MWEGDQYLVRVDEQDPTQIEMSFNLTNYQPHLRAWPRPIYQARSHGQFHPGCPCQWGLGAALTLWPTEYHLHNKPSTLRA